MYIHIFTYKFIFYFRFLAVLEFMIGTKQQSEEMGTSWITEVMEEMRFALQCYGSSKVIIDLPFSKYVHKGLLRLLCNLVERYILYNKIALEEESMLTP